MRSIAYVPTAPSQPHRAAANSATALPVRLLLMAIAIAALGVSAFLAWVALTGKAVPGCGTDGWFNCDEVLSTRWSKWFNLPVALPAASMYAGILALLLFTFGFAPAKIQNAAWRVIAVLAASAALAAIWFIVLQGFIVKHWCPWCLAVHSSGLVLAIIVFAFAPPARRLPVLTSLVAFCLVGVLVTGQLLSQEPEVFVEQDLGIAWGESTPPAPVAGAEDDDSQDITAPETDTQEPGSTNAEPQSPEPAEQAPTLLAETDDTEDTAPIEHTTSRPVIEDESDMATEPPGEEPAAEVASAEQPAEEPGADDAPRDVASQSRTADDAEFATENLTEDEPRVALQPADGSENVAANEPTESEEPGETPEPAVEEPAPQRLFTLAADQPQINIYDYPILGSPQAEIVIFEMFDYTCPHCRHLTETMEEAREKYGDDLAVVLLPMPMNGACNRLVSGSDPKHLYACQLARYALAVWMESPEDFEEYHHWLMEGEDAPSREEAFSRASNYASANKLLELSRSEEAADRISASVNLYGAWGRGTIPKVVAGGRVLSGNVRSRMYQLIDGQLQQ